MEGNSATTTESVDQSTPQAPAPPPVKLDKEGKELAREAAKAESRKKIAESQKAIVEAQQAALEAALPTTETKPLAGDITVGEGVGIISDRIAYSLVSDASAKVAEKVKDVLGTRGRLLIVEDRDLIASDWAFELVRLQLDTSIEAMTKAKEVVEDATPSPPGDAERVITPAELEELVAGTGVQRGVGVDQQRTANFLWAPSLAALVPEAMVGAAADIAGFFRSDYSLTAKEIKLGTTPLTAAICSHLSDSSSSIELDRFARLDETGIVDKFKQALTSRMELRRLTSILKSRVVDPAARQVEALRAELGEVGKSLNAEKDANQRRVLEDREARLKADIANAEKAAGPAAGAALTAEALLTGFDALAEKFTKAPDGGGLTPLATAAIREQLHGGATGYTHVLYASVESAGGESIARKSVWPWWNLMTFLGGAQLSYLMVDLRDNSVKAAGSESLLGTVKLKLSSGRADPIDPVPLKERRRGSLWRVLLHGERG